MIFHLVLLVFAFCVFAFAATNWCAEGLKVRMVAVGLAFATASFIFAGAMPLLR